MSERPAATFPGPVRQVGHLVTDLDAAMTAWLALGVGPWTAIEARNRGQFRGQPSDATTRIGFANVGPMQIELIEATGQAHSIWHRDRDRGRFGPHHIAYWTDDYDATTAAGLSGGLTLAQVGDGNGLTRFAYFEGPTGQLIEIMELNELVSAFMDGIRASSEDWDGSDPIRR